MAFAGTWQVSYSLSTHDSSMQCHVAAPRSEPMKKEWNFYLIMRGGALTSPVPFMLRAQRSARTGAVSGACTDSGDRRTAESSVYI